MGNTCWLDWTSWFISELTDPVDARDACPLLANLFLSISCIFCQKCSQIIGWQPLGDASLPTYWKIWIGHCSDSYFFTSTVSKEKKIDSVLVVNIEISMRSEKFKFVFNAYISIWINEKQYFSVINLSLN